jgi:hypothetical protein
MEGLIQGLLGGGLAILFLLLLHRGLFLYRDVAYIVYIFQSDRDGSIYIGHTGCLEERVRRHNEGRSHIPKLKPHGEWYVRRNISRGLKP